MPSRREREEHEGRLPQPGVPAGPRNTAGIEPPRHSGATTLYPQGTPGSMVEPVLPSQPGGVSATPAEVAADLLAKNQHVTRDTIIRSLLDAPVPKLSDPKDEKKSALKTLKQLATELDQISSGDELGSLGPAESRIADKVLDVGTGDDASKKELLAAAETGLVESGFKNLGYGDADSEGWRQERSMYYPNPRNVGASADRFFDELKTDAGTQTASSAGLMAQAAQGSAYPERYDENEEAGKAIVQDYLKGDEHPKLEHAVRQAKQKAIAAGVSPRKVGDIVDAEPQGQTVKVRADAKGMVDWAQHLEGTQEGTPKQHKWADLYGLGYEEPWCANFISNGLSRRGIKPPPNPNYVPSYENEWEGGNSIGTDLSKAKPGDLITYSGQHIALYMGNGKAISGNSGDEVAVTDAAEGPAPISAILRPGYQGGTVQMPVTSANSSWGAQGSEGGGITSSASSDPSSLMTAALDHTQAAQPAQESRLSKVMALLDSPLPSIGGEESEVVGPPEWDEDELLKLAMRR